MILLLAINETVQHTVLGCRLSTALAQYIVPQAAFNGLIYRCIISKNIHCKFVIQLFSLWAGEKHE